MISLTRPVPDQERALRNLETLLAAHPASRDRIVAHADDIAALFSCSQFLATYSANNPASLLDEQSGALALMHREVTYEALRDELHARLANCSSREEGMSIIRRFRKDKQLAVVLRDVMRRTEQQQIMLEMSHLADAILQESLAFVEKEMRERFGSPDDNGIVMIGMGKLGAQELNFSSDVDPIFVYRNEGETSGISGMAGVARNRISAFEFYVKLVEELTRFISANTADGFAYRVDLRLRPQGTRGSLALSLIGHEEYYESWGQLWERAALLRARPVAGDATLGADFLAMIEPFIFRKYLDLDAIEEIRRMKSQVEQLKGSSASRDIKRGFGGIREIEFFIQIFQLMYGGKVPILRERSTLKALHRILQKGFIGHDDSYHLSENYLYLRKLEHRIQQTNDLQTHSLPTSDRDLAVLALKMGYPSKPTFLEDLQQRRRKVRAIYDSLMQAPAAKSERPSTAASLFAGAFWDLDTPDSEQLTAELAVLGVRDPAKALYHLSQIRATTYTFQTLRGRRLMEDLIPRFVEEALKTPNPDRALLQMVDFSRLLATNESYLEPIVQHNDLIRLLVSLFAQSDYLAKLVMGNPEYTGSLIEGEIRWRTRSEIRHELDVLSQRKDPMQAARILRRLEEIRLGTRFLNKLINVVQLTHSLTTIAETIAALLLRAEMPHDPSASGDSELVMLGYGKLGGREISFNSDLDVVFITTGNTTTEQIRQAEGVLRAATSYTKDGIAYSVDTRLRPDGNKGPLVVPLTGLQNYYAKYAHPWELQALLKARPITGSRAVRLAVLAMREEILTERGGSVTFADVRRMRERIRTERARDASAAASFDVKLGAGGINEIEFLVQYLQLANARKNPSILVQNTLDAVRRLGLAGILSPEDTAFLRDAYKFFRVVETILRLRNESVLKENGRAPESIARLLGMSADEVLAKLRRCRDGVLAFVNRY
ncbi:MAG TPA: bifunctional [glutamate--ammonia ligase]-adenylyl-L-tyrosine phosphorylase/[glutamate--ammonia-ligase] adenylyltransferase [Dissulfurispiraceae bacterium]|nr:bifunctional [glutamate--ammonia ligase]-adenylyl-L-tyrosine phosphorylase/[glutamate--ammonia-ligase] adenylyltransferase [Dissulfurispiraceae bacterium]